jgi:hypothetical protein
MGLHETKQLLHSKGNSHQTEEIAQRMEEHHGSYTLDKGIITIIQGT